MYSVLIQNEKTYNNFINYQPFFSKACNDNKIGLCKWVESGTSLESALPELPSLVNDKEEWCAVVVRTSDESQEKGYDADVFNPYDFAASKSARIGDLEDIPLIRLTHILGGFPTYDINFEPEVVKERHMSAKTVFNPIADKEEHEIYKQMEETYTYNGRKPSLIIIVTARENNESEINLEAIWQPRKESESSEFWKRNQYPSICRYAVCDFSNEGPIQRNADQINMWLSVLMMCINFPDSSVLQANRLYSLSCDFNKEKMEDTLQNVVYKLKSNKYYIEKSLSNEKAKEISTDEKIPEYRVPCSVVTKKPNFKELSIGSKIFKLLSRGKYNDNGIWKHHKMESEKALSLCVRDSERKLDQAAEAIKSKCFVKDFEAEKINKYQYEDMQAEAKELYRNIIEEQGYLPNDNFKANQKMKKAEKAVTRILSNRLTKKTFLLTLVIIAVVLLFVNLPGLVSHFILEKGSISGFLGLFVIEWLVVFSSSFFLLLIERGKLKSAINMFNSGLKEEFVKLAFNVSLYSDYVSNIASYSRLSHYLDLIKQNDNDIASKNKSKIKHLKAIDNMLYKIKKWSTAYHLDLDLDTGFTDNNVLYDFNENPSESSLYELASNQMFSTEINNSGIPLDSPYEFIENVNITREEVYDG